MGNIIQDTPEERIFKTLVRFPAEFQYAEGGPDFYKVMDPVTKKYFKISITEVKEKPKPTI